MDLGGPKLRTGAIREEASHKGALILHEGDTLTLTRQPLPGEQAELDENGRIVHPAHISCQAPEAFDFVHAGERVLLDDGKIGGVIVAVGPDGIQINITRAREAGEKLRSEKGINLPDSDLHLPSMMERDARVLPFIAEHADMVGYSFVQSADDIRNLQARMAALTPTPPSIVLKIETQRAFAALPDLLLAAMRDRTAGVMIARGDLAVELGYQRMAEVQEEILWICEAAHMPVIWATQVLENLARTGRPSRAEITDAAMGVRAECVMLNKGPYIVEAVRALNDILLRMQAHQSKKRTLLRELHAWAGVDN
jgi:pyruvate kinase